MSFRGLVNSVYYVLLLLPYSTLCHWFRIMSPWPDACDICLLSRFFYCRIGLGLCYDFKPVSSCSALLPFIAVRGESRCNTFTPKSTAIVNLGRLVVLNTRSVFLVSYV